MITDIGGRLRDARVGRGMSLRDAAQRTKLSIATLEAIERNDFERLPGGMYRKAYLRSVAAEVGVDPAAIAAAYDERFAPAPAELVETPIIAPPQDELVRQLAPPDRPSPFRFIMLVMMAVGWFTMTSAPEAANWIGAVANAPVEAREPIPAFAPALADIMSPYAAAPAPIDPPPTRSAALSDRGRAAGDRAASPQS